MSGDIEIKVVPDDQPNADGHSIIIPASEAPPKLSSKWVIMEQELAKFIPAGHHLVAVTRRII